MQMQDDIMVKAKEREQVFAKIAAVFAEYEKEKNAVHERPERLRVLLSRFNLI